MSADGSDSTAGHIFASPADIELLTLDVDGVLTDGSILLDDDRRETKRFNARDGFAIRLWAQMGFTTAIVTGRTGSALLHRMAELGVGEIVQGSKDKAESLAALEQRLGIPAHHVAHVGDDWPDLPILRKVGYPIAVADAEPAVREACAWTTPRPGGRGAVRDAVEHLLSAKGVLGEALGLYDQ